MSGRSSDAARRFLVGSHYLELPDGDEDAVRTVTLDIVRGACGVVVTREACRLDPTL